RSSTPPSRHSRPRPRSKFRTRTWQPRSSRKTTPIRRRARATSRAPRVSSRPVLSSGRKDRRPGAILAFILFIRLPLSLRRLMSRSTFWSGIVAVPAGAVRFMFAIGRLAGSTSLFVLVLALAGALGSGQSARAADIHFIGGQDGTDNSWNNPANWSSDPVLPGNNDDVTIDVEDPAFGVNGAIINDGETEKINSLVINASLNVLEGGQLTVVNAITNNGPGYFVNEGAVFVQNNGGTVGTV